MTHSDQSARSQQRRKARVWLTALAAAAALGGCAGQQMRSTETSPPPAPAVAAAEPTPAETQDRGSAQAPGAGPGSPCAQLPAAAVPGPIWQRLRQGFRLQGLAHPRIDRELRRLARSPRELHALLERAAPFLHHIADAVEEAGLPGELALLPAIESSFRAHVYSPDGAAGLWQFMPATGRMLGLRQDWWFDSRRALRASTAAAMTYLEHLNGRFEGDWLHTLAAYNAGARTVGQAIRRAARRGEPTDFWSLDLPGETDRYVPRLLALSRLVARPEDFGLELPPIDDQPYFTVVDTAGQIDLTVAAQLAGFPLDDLLRLNAGHKRWATHPDGPHQLLLPTDRADAFAQALAELPEDQRLRWQRHRIRRGDSLSRIARQYGVSVGTIRRANGLPDSRIRAGRYLLIPRSDGVNLAALESNRQGRQRVRYRVRKGDSLYTIARRFQVSISDLRRWNDVGRYIHPGERLTVFIDPDA